MWVHWYPCFGLLVTSALGIKARVVPLACMFHRLYAMDFSDSPLVQNLPILLADSMAAEPL